MLTILMEGSDMKRIKTRVASLVFSVILAFGLFGVMPQVAYATVPTISGVHVTPHFASAYVDADVGFDLDVNSTVYFMVDLASNPAPDAATVMAQTTGVWRFEQSVTAGYGLTQSITGLPANTALTLYMVAEDVATPGDISAVTTLNVAVCEIGSDPYASLADALDAVQTGETITLLTSISEATPVTVSGTDLIIDLAGYNLDLNGDDITITGGTLTIENGGTVTVDGMVADGSTLTVDANIVGSVVALNGSTVIVTGNITADFACVMALGAGTTVALNGNITVTGGGQDIAVHAFNGATIKVTGDISSDYEGVYAEEDGTVVTVIGDITSNGTAAAGINATGGAKVAMIGNITSTLYGIYAAAGAGVTLTGNITCDTGTDDVFSYTGGGVALSDGGTGIGRTVTVNGDISVNGIRICGVNAFQGPNIAQINGKITVTGAGSVGVLADGGSQVTVDGAIDPDNYVGFWDFDATSMWNPFFLTQAGNDTTSLKDGYLQYSWTATNGNTFTSYIWVKIPDQPIPGPAIPQTGDTHGMADLALILALSALVLVSTGVVLARKRTRKEGNTQS